MTCHDEWFVPALPCLVFCFMSHPGLALLVLHSFPIAVSCSVFCPDSVTPCVLSKLCHAWCPSCVSPSLCVLPSLSPFVLSSLCHALWSVRFLTVLCSNWVVVIFLPVVCLAVLCLVPHPVFALFQTVFCPNCVMCTMFCPTRFSLCLLSYASCACPVFF